MSVGNLGELESKPMTDLVTALTILGVSPAGQATVKLVTDFAREVVSPTAKATGEGIAAPIKHWAEQRSQRAAKTVVDAAVMLDEAGIKAQAVPPQISVPLLQAASMLDDPELHTRWAALLASAATPGSDIIPGFVEILRQLTSVQAQILDWMYAKEYEQIRDLPRNWPDVERKDIEEKFNLSAKQYALLITDLERLQLIEPRRDLRLSDEGHDIVDMERMIPLIVDRWNSRVKYDSIGFTSLGLQFIEACTPPASRRP